MRIGALLRDSCGADPDCANRVTRDVTRHCYAARYAAATEHLTPSSDVVPDALSPCFWDRDQPTSQAPAQFAVHTCKTLVDAPLRPACVAELRMVIESLCTEGTTELTGAGP